MQSTCQLLSFKTLQCMKRQTRINIFLFIKHFKPAQTSLIISQKQWYSFQAVSVKLVFGKGDMISLSSL